MQAAASRARAAQAERKAAQEGPDRIPSKRQLSAQPTGQTKAAQPSHSAEQQATPSQILRSDSGSAAAAGREAQAEQEQLTAVSVRQAEDDRRSSNPLAERKSQPV